MFSILFFAIISFLIGYKLFTILGDTKHDSEISEEKRSHLRQMYEKFRQTPKNEAAIEIEAEQTKEDADMLYAKNHNMSPELQQFLAYCKTKNASFSIETFISGVKFVFTEILQAISENDKQTIKNYASEECAKSICKNMEDLAASGQAKNIKVVGIKSIEIIDGFTENGQDYLQLTLLSEQIISIHDKDTNALISGSITKILNCKDTWTFIRSGKNFWLLDGCE